MHNVKAIRDGIETRRGELGRSYGEATDGSNRACDVNNATHTVALVESAYIYIYIFIYLL